MSDTLIYNIIKKTIELRDATHLLNKDRGLLLEMAQNGISEDNLNSPKYKSIMSKQENSEKIIAELFSLLDELDVLEGREVKTFGG
jgi:hypothetical protein